jgi:signal transduction histidine kinase
MSSVQPGGAGTQLVGGKSPTVAQSKRGASRTKGKVPVTSLLGAIRRKDSQSTKEADNEPASSPSVALADYLRDVRCSAPQTDILCWQYLRHSDTLSLKASTKDRVFLDTGFDFGSNECLVGECFRSGSFSTDQLSLANRHPAVTDPFIQTASQLKWRSARFELAVLPQRKTGWGVIGFFSANRNFFSSRQLSRIGAEARRISRLMEFSEEIIRRRENEKQIAENLIVLHSYILALEHMHEIKHNAAAVMNRALEIRAKFGKLDRTYADLSSLIVGLEGIEESTRNHLDSISNHDLVFRRVDLVGLVRSSVSHHRVAARAQNVAVREFLPSTPITIDGDSQRLKSVFDNLLRNAVWFAQTSLQKPEVVVSISKHQSKAQVVVMDNGRGIEHVDRIWDLGYSTRKDGTGIGLSVSKAIIDKHEGASIQASTVVNHSSKFTVTFKVA